MLSHSAVLFARYDPFGVNVPLSCDILVNSLTLPQRVDHTNQQCLVYCATMLN